ncbi:MAG: hypothetical protein ACKVHU_05540 [Acidimicrobiales bacterium]
MVEEAPIPIPDTVVELIPLARRTRPQAGLVHSTQIDLNGNEGGRREELQHNLIRTWLGERAMSPVAEFGVGGGGLVVTSEFTTPRRPWFGVGKGDLVTTIHREKEANVATNV